MYHRITRITIRHPDNNIKIPQRLGICMNNDEFIHILSHKELSMEYMGRTFCWSLGLLINIDEYNER